MPTEITETGLSEIIAKMQAFPEKLKEGLKTTMQDALLILWQNVPKYPPPPDNSTYTRTGTLGRSLGSSEAGGQSGNPDIYTVKELGSARFEAHFGTNLDYAPYVIGDDTQAHQNSHWWVMGDIAKKAHDRVISLFQMLGATMARWLDNQ